LSFWHNKVALVIGGSAGLGRHLVETFARAGARVAFCGRRPQPLEHTASELKMQFGGTPLPLQADLTQEADAARVIDATIEQFGQLDVLVNCAGRSHRSAILETTPSDFEELWKLNFLAAVHTTRAAAPHLMSRRGSLVNIGSLASKVSSPYLGAYPASKFALAAYSQQLRLELGEQGLHVLLVCPGPIRREDAGSRYDRQADSLPESARRPGGGAKLQAIDPAELASRILHACQRRKSELVIPRKARLLFAIAQLWPNWGDRILKKKAGA